MKATFDYGGRTILVTGGTSGIGLAIALAFRDAGGKVWITGTRASSSDYPDDLSGLTFRQLDMQDGAAINALPAELPSLDVLINCAGNTVRNDEAYQPDNFEKVIAINLSGTFRLSMAALPLLKKGPGNVINIASMTSYFGAPGSPGYGASKAGVLELTQTLGVAWAPFGIRVNGIAPGWIETKLTDYWREDQRDRQILERTPLARWGRPEEMAGAALFLASSAAGFITGITLPVDGGYTAK
ncbi:MAG: SDR family NAD(P)-dependent oxidoreductase [Geminicoccaceae bacterium]